MDDLLCGRIDGALACAVDCWKERTFGDRCRPRAQKLPTHVRGITLPGGHVSGESVSGPAPQDSALVLAPTWETIGDAARRVYTGF